MSLKDKILEFLIENTDTYISGQHLAEKYGVSRNSVWKAVNQIKADGYTVDSTSNRGYRLSAKSDVLSCADIKSNLEGEAEGLSVIVLDSVDSTNNEAKRMTANGCNKDTLIVANEQTGGRGRLGRSFYSPKNTGIYMSFLLHTQLELSDAVAVTTAAAVAVVRAIEKLTPIKPVIKWVNDVYIDDKKICGILTEGMSGFEQGTAQTVIIGIGINITTSDFPDDIRGRAGAVNSDGLHRNNLIAETANELCKIFCNLSDKSYIDDYRRCSMVIGKKIDFYRNNVKQTAKAMNIDRNGGLIVMLADGTVTTLTSGEVTVRLSEN